MHAVKRISFDANGTLFKAAVASKYKIHADPEALTKSFLKSWMLWNEKAPNFGHRAHMKPEVFWHHVVLDTFAEVISPNALQLHGKKIAEELYQSFQTAQFWRVYPEAPAVLTQLKSAGYRLCVISNFDHRLPTVMKALNLDHYFDFVLSSLAVGYEKPEIQIFQEALRRGEWSADSVLHVGDNLRRDYEGAQRAGMNALLIDRAADETGLNRVLQVLKEGQKSTNK